MKNIESLFSSIEIFDNPLTRTFNDKIRKRVIFTISGPSGVGKDAIINWILSEYSAEFIKPVAFTTRKPRPGDIEGKDYYFIDKEKFEELKKNGEIFEYTDVHGNFYGFTNSEIERSISTGKTPICNVDEEGMRQIQENMNGDFNIFKTFFLPPNAQELKKRLVGRDGRWAGSRDDKGNKKISDVRKRFFESSHWIRRAQDGTMEYDAFLVNNDLESTKILIFSTFRKIINGELGR
ncbi:MAG: hypothetical protein PHS92_01790 [Candidatus Gracilibacteria bacterium]|nr:hypothetical protein [Candidatus Gracilibacteria bacterium]